MKCVVCGKEFEPKHKLTVCCSGKCKDEKIRLNQYNYRMKKLNAPETIKHMPKRQYIKTKGDRPMTPALEHFITRFATLLRRG